MFIGFITAGSAKNNTSLIVGSAFIGFVCVDSPGGRLGLASLTSHLSQGGGNAQLAAFALPELLPNKWRHWAIVLADIGVFFAVLVGPVAGRFSVQHHDAVRLEGSRP